MKPRAFTILLFLILQLVALSSSQAALNAVNVGKDGVTFPDNSLQKKAVVLPTCTSGEVYVNSGGALLCGRIKLVPNGIATCVETLCAVSSCADGFGDCNGGAGNGCETNLLTDAQHCNACGTPCDAHGVCTGGLCTYPPYLASLSPNPGSVIAGAQLLMSAVLSAPAEADSTVILNSDNPSMALVAPQVVIAAGQSQAQFTIAGIAPGTANITASLNGNEVIAPVTVFADLCLPNSPCINPPPSSCSNGTLTTYQNPGTCSPLTGSFSCTYAPTTSQCLSGSCSGNICTPEVCGDGIKTASEACDDGNTTSSDGCSSTCQIESGWQCAGSPSSCAPICGDGIKKGMEACDDGNSTSGDGCSATCQVETGFSCSGSPSACSATCGDGVVAGGEQCDDGNMVNGDGCTQACQIEAGFQCSGSPSVCHGSLNETGLPLEADFCIIQFPASFSVSAGTQSPNIFGRIFEAGMTEAAGAHLSIKAQLGFGPNGTNPITQPAGWTFVNAAFNAQVGNDDEYVASFTAPQAGSYGYVYRFSLDSGASYTYCDTDGAGSNASLVFSAAQLGVMTVTP